MAKGKLRGKKRHVHRFKGRARELSLSSHGKPWLRLQSGMAPAPGSTSSRGTLGRWSPRGRPGRWWIICPIGRASCYVCMHRFFLSHVSIVVFLPRLVLPYQTAFSSFKKSRPMYNNKNKKNKKLKKKKPPSPDLSNISLLL